MNNDNYESLVNSLKFDNIDDHIKENIEYYRNQLLENDYYYEGNLDEDLDEEEYLLDDNECNYETENSNIEEEESEEEKNLRKLFFEMANQYSRLSVDEERELAKRKDEGDVEAKEILIGSNLPLVINIATKYRNLGIEFEELLAIGNEELVEAVIKYDVNHKSNSRFASYAYKKIAGRIKKELSIHTGGGAYSIYIVNRILRLKRIEREFQIENGRNPTIEELSDLLGCQENTIKKYQEIESKLFIDSMDKKLGDDEDSQTLGDNISDEDKSTEKEALNNGNGLLSNGNLVVLAMYFLTDREKFVVLQLSGAFGNEKKTYKEIADIIGCGEGRIKEIEERAKDRLIHKLKEYGIERKYE